MTPAAALKAILPRSLLGRALLIIILPLVLVQLISTYVFYENHWDRLTRQLVDGFVGEVAAVVELLENAAAPDERARALAAARSSLRMAATFRQDAVLPAIRSPVEESALAETLARILDQRLRRPFHLDLAGGDRMVTVNIQLAEGVLRIVTSRKRFESFTTYVFVLWMVGSSALLFGVALIFMRNQVRSVRRLATAVDSFGKGREVGGFKPEGALEVRQAAIAFNLMRERIRRQIAQRTEMLAGVSHDLRTPLTRMRLQLAMMGEVEGVGELLEDVAEMERMVEGYLAFARGEGTERMVPTDLVALLEEVVGRFRREGASVDLHCEEEIQLPLRPHAFDRCLSNLIGNACRHAGHVAVRAGRRGTAVEITIDDNGPGIPADKREDVFKAFCRLDVSRNRRTGGVGLGLTITRDLVRGHGGEIRLDDSPLGGLRVRVRLPI